MKDHIRKNIFLPLILLILAGCVSTGFGTPWNHDRYDRPADQAPKQLTAEDALYHPADNEIQAEPVGMEYTAQGQRAAEESRNGVQYYNGNNRLPYSRYGRSPQSRNNDRQVTPAALPSSGRHSVKVAILVPLSGEHADLGQALLKSAQMALFDLGSDNFSLIPRDTKATPKAPVKPYNLPLKTGQSLLSARYFPAPSGRSSLWQNVITSTFLLFQPTGCLPVTIHS